MELLRNTFESKYDGLQGEVWFNLFEKYINFSAEEGVDLKYVNFCGKYLNELPDKAVQGLCEASIRYCNKFLQAIGEPEKYFENYKDILRLIYPSVLIVPVPEGREEPVIWMELNCEWEPEHGMEWIIRNNKVMYVGGFNGIDPWSDCDAGKSWNYA